MTETELRTLFVDTARRFYGIAEGSEKHREILAAYNGHAPLARGYTMSEKDPWCAAFVSAIAILCGLTEIIPTECSCSRMIALHKALGTWNESDDLDPQPGDLLIYDWEDSGKGDNTGDPDHIGIVVRVTKGVIRVIEGNLSNKVWHRDMEVNGRYIRGYCRPDFARAAAALAVTEGDPLDKPITRRELLDMLEELAERLAHHKSRNGDDVVSV